MTERPRYPSDISDARWALIEPVLSAWQEARLARSVVPSRPKYALHEIWNALPYLNRTGVQWQYLPHDFPPYQKKIVGRKRGIVTDTLGLLLTVIVMAASVTENAAGMQLVSQAKAVHSQIAHIWADSGFKNKAVEHAADLGVSMEIVSRKSDEPGFHVVKRRRRRAARGGRGAVPSSATGSGRGSPGAGRRPPGAGVPARARAGSW